MRLSTPISIRISGMGGQGNILMGKVLAEALMKQGYWTVQTQHYGAQVRGGESFCDVLFDKEPIDFPKSEVFHIIYLMHDIAINHLKYIKNNGIVFYDTEYVSAMPTSVHRTTKKTIPVEASKIAYGQLGNVSVSNMVGLGAIAKVTDIVSLDNIMAAIKENVKPSFFEIDEKALKLGYDSVDRKYFVPVEDSPINLAKGFE